MSAAESLKAARAAGISMEVDGCDLILQASAVCSRDVIAPGAPKGNRNAFKHGRYTTEALARRREVAALIRTMRALAGATEEGD